MAARESDSQPQRQWVPVTVGVCHWQTVADRFGPDAKSIVQDREQTMDAFWIPEPEIPTEDPDENSVDERSLHNLVPITLPLRNNLTALSQAYNLYFVAYQSEILVYVPRCIVRQRLPKHPDCRLRCQPSSVARLVKGHIDPRVPHAVNNLVTGFLGSKEIVVACCDDGDVYAYYTKDIAEWISSKHNSPLPHHAGPTGSPAPSTKSPTHFFRENIGESAWGLAVHQQSRLIAVSSNRQEITVFAFALKTLKNPSDLRQDMHPSLDGPAAFVRSRTKDFRIILALGERATNLPSICFIEDNQGEAEKISAVDIDGAAWISNIWTANQPVEYLGPLDGLQRPSEELWGAPSRGWGILALPSDSFLTVNTVEELIGGTPGRILPVNRACSQRMVDIEPCVRAIPDNPCPPVISVGASENDDPVIATMGIPNNITVALINIQAAMNGAPQPEIATVSPNPGLETASDDLEDAVDESDVSITGDQYSPLWASFTSASTNVAESNLNWHETGRQLVYYPHSGRIKTVPEETFALASFLMDSRTVNSLCSGLGTLGSALRGYHLVRAYEKDLELRALDTDIDGQREIGIFCPNTLTFGYRSGVFWRRTFRWTSRMNLMLHVPELSLVIIGSPTGRVLLITPTRLPSRQKVEAGYWRHGMRVDWVLPRTSDDTRQPHDRRPLHGIAVGPVQDEGGVGGRGSRRDSIPHRYRLMLHYRSHDIASFEITRQEQTGKLCVF